MGASAALAQHVNGFIARTVPLLQEHFHFCELSFSSVANNFIIHLSHYHQRVAKMSDQIQELIDIPRDFIKDGTMFINRCTKRKSSLGRALGLTALQLHVLTEIADKREFIKISQAVGVGFLVMGGTYCPHL